MPLPTLNHVQEVEVFYILPAVRKELAVAMKQQGLEQKKIAEHLGVTEAAVSQYLNSKRASLSLPESVKKKIQEVAKRVRDTFSLRRETQEILETIKNERFTCGVCQNYSTAHKGCSICFD